eukprot:SAG22_NODE_2251_length_2786_cov_21.764793_2_plen_427_part_00
MPALPPPSPEKPQGGKDLTGFKWRWAARDKKYKLQFEFSPRGTTAQLGTSAAKVNSGKIKPGGWTEAELEEAKTARKSFGKKLEDILAEGVTREDWDEQVEVAVEAVRNELDGGGGGGGVEPDPGGGGGGGGEPDPEQEPEQEPEKEPEGDSSEMSDDLDGDYPTDSEDDEPGYDPEPEPEDEPEQEPEKEGEQEPEQEPEKEPEKEVDLKEENQKTELPHDIAPPPGLEQQVVEANQKIAEQQQQLDKVQAEAKQKIAEQQQQLDKVHGKIATKQALIQGNSDDDDPVFTSAVSSGEPEPEYSFSEIQLELREFMSKYGSKGDRSISQQKMVDSLAARLPNHNWTFRGKPADGPSASRISGWTNEKEQDVPAEFVPHLRAIMSEHRALQGGAEQEQEPEGEPEQEQEPEPEGEPEQEPAGALDVA